MLIDTQKIMAVILLLVSVMGLSACGGSSGDDEFKEAVVVNDMKITSIYIEPSNSTVEVGVTERYVARANIDSNSSDPDPDVTTIVRWSSSDESIVSISASGVATTHADGMVEIRAEIADLSDFKDLTVSSAALERIEIKTDIDNVDAIGICTHSNEFKADGFYENEDVARNITTIVTWTSEKEKIAEISTEIGTEGHVSALLVGTSILTAARHGLVDTQEITVEGDSLTSIAITPDTDVTVFIGGDQQFTAMGTYGADELIDITQTVDWEVDDSGNLTVSNNKADKGLAEGVKAGDATIVASCGADASVTPAVEAVQTSNTVDVTVKAAVTIDSIQINDGASTKTGTVGGSDIQLTATLVYSDGTTKDVADDSKTSWSVRGTNSGETAEVSDTGLVTYTAVGSTEIKVVYEDSDDDVYSDTIDVDIN